MQVEPIYEDLQYAQTQDRWACVIVRAIQRQIPDSTFVRVDKETISFSSHGHRYYHVTPPEMIEDIIRPFDENHPDQVKLGIYPLIVANVTKVRKMTPENREKLRRDERTRTAKRIITKNNRSHDRFCETDGADNG
jgi:hypothetical protein